MKKIYVIAVLCALMWSCEESDKAPQNLTYTPSDYLTSTEAALTTVSPRVEGTAPFVFSLANAPQGVAIDSFSGIITVETGHAFAEGHSYTLDVTVENTAGSRTFAAAVRVTVKKSSELEGVTAPSDLKYIPSSYAISSGTDFVSNAPTVMSEEEVSYALVYDYGFFTIDGDTGRIGIAADRNAGGGAYDLSVEVSNGVASTVFENALRVDIDTPLPESLAGKGYQLVWHDEFDQAELDKQKWKHRYAGSVRGYATVSEDNVTLDGEGNLLIRATEKDGTYYIGMIGTQGLFAAKYGYFECRAKMQSSVGPHSSFWLQSDGYGRTDDPAVDGIEVDIFEYLRNYKTVVYQTFHWNAYSSATYQKREKQTVYSSVQTGFHTFGVEWTEDGYQFYIDGEKTQKDGAPYFFNEEVSKREQYIVLSLSLNSWGGGGNGTDISTSTTRDKWSFPDAVAFDYVRVFQK